MIIRPAPGNPTKIGGGITFAGYAMSVDTDGGKRCLDFFAKNLKA